jgi:hypothetical protein
VPLRSLLELYHHQQQQQHHHLEPDRRDNLQSLVLFTHRHTNVYFAAVQFGAMDALVLLLPTLSMEDCIAMRHPLLELNIFEFSVLHGTQNDGASCSVALLRHCPMLLIHSLHRHVPSTLILKTPALVMDILPLLPADTFCFCEDNLKNNLAHLVINFEHCFESYIHDNTCSIVLDKLQHISIKSIYLYIPIFFFLY